MKNTLILALAFFAMVLVVSCSGKGDSVNDAEGKIEYAPEVSEVDIITLKEEDFPLQLLSNGKLSAAKHSALSFRQGGIVTKVNVTNGSKVLTGQIIAELDNSEQQAALDAAMLDFDRASLDLQDVLVGLGYPLGRQDSIPDNVMKVASIRSGYAAAKNGLVQARKNFDETILRAPFSGHVADVKIKQWESAGPEPFCTVLGDSEFDVNFTVLESEYNFISKGQHVSVSTFFGTELVSGRIVSINPLVGNNGQIAVTARIPAAKGMLDGMNVNVMVDKVIGHQLVVPKSAVVIRDGLEVLFRYNGNDCAEWVYVDVVQTNSTSHAVCANTDRGSELKVGEQIIVSGNLNLTDGSHVVVKGQK